MMDDGGAGDTETPETTWTFAVEEDLSFQDLELEELQDSRSASADSRSASADSGCSWCRLKKLNLQLQQMPDSENDDMSDLDREDLQDVRCASVCSRCRLRQHNFELQHLLDLAYEKISDLQARNRENLSASDLDVSYQSICSQESLNMETLCKALTQLPHPQVDFSDVEEEQEPELDAIPEMKGHPKSWWRRQANKVVKGMATFRLRLKRCLGIKTKKPGVRLVRVQPVKSNTTFIMHVSMAPASVDMPPVSV